MMDLESVLQFRPAALNVIPLLFHKWSGDFDCRGCGRGAQRCADIAHGEGCPVGAFLKIIEWPGQVEGKPDL